MGLSPKGYPTFVEERGLTSSSDRFGSTLYWFFIFIFPNRHVVINCFILFYFLDKQTCLFVRFGLPERKPKPSLRACSRTEPVQGPARDCSRRTEQNCSVDDSSASSFNITEQLSSKRILRDI